MSMSMLNRTIYRICLGVLLLASAQFAAAAGWVSGTVTAFNPLNSSIVIDGNAFTLSASASYTATKEIRSGQAVRYEADGKLIKRIEVVTLPLT